MNLTPYVDALRQELAVAADAAGPEAYGVAERLSRPLESAARLALLGALSDAMAEVTRELAPGSVAVRLRGTDPEFVVTAPQPYETHDTHPTYRTHEAQPGHLDAGGDTPDTTTARINLRLPANLKAQAEAAAAREGLSLNAWLGQAVTWALTAPPTASPTTPPAPPHDFTGWTG